MKRVRMRVIVDGETLKISAISAWAFTFFQPLEDEFLLRGVEFWLVFFKLAFFFARSRSSLVRMEIRSRSNSAIIASIETNNLPMGSDGSWMLDPMCRLTPFSSSSVTIAYASVMECASWSSLVMTKISPARTASNLGRFRVAAEYPLSTMILVSSTPKKCNYFRWLVIS